MFVNTINSESIDSFKKMLFYHAMHIIEGVYDSNIFKCVFMGGGPGAGKSTVIQDLFKVKRNFNLSVTGLKLIN